MKKKFGIVKAAFPNVILLQNDCFTDELRNYLKANTTAYLVKRCRREPLGYKIVKIFPE